jgi:ribA/ribD-fused uncharacterized protein
VNRQKKEIQKKAQLELLAITPIDSFRGAFRFLSNFSPAVVEFDGRTFYSTEAAYQSAKTLDSDVRDMFVSLTASESKALGNNPEIVVLREDWEEVKDSVMLDLVQQKFSNKELRRKLNATRPRVLVESNNWHDVYWGVCVGCKKFGPHPPTGQNKLGQTLMYVRDEFII